MNYYTVTPAGTACQQLDTQPVNGRSKTTRKVRPMTTFIIIIIIYYVKWRYKTRQHALIFPPA